jgi:hypothetical protein
MTGIAVTRQRVYNLNLHTYRPKLHTYCPKLHTYKFSFKYKIKFIILPLR